MADRRGIVTILPEGEGCNPQDGPGWDRPLRAALARLARAPGGVAAAVVGMPGHGEVPAHDAATVALVAALLSAPAEIMNDVALARIGALGDGDGVLVLAGTGSMAVATGPSGTVRVGGWGDAFGDEGSAHWIGREALAMAARAMDGREPEAGPFARALCARLGATGAFAPLSWLMEQPGGPRAAMAGVARIVDALALDALAVDALAFDALAVEALAGEALAGEGSAPARALLDAAAGHLALAARVAGARAGLAEGFAWTRAGGAFRSRALRDGLARRLGPPAALRMTTLGGGLLRAARRAGWAPDAAWTARVDARLRAWDG